MNKDKIKDSYIEYWNEHYHNLQIPIQQKHELKKFGWEMFKAGYLSKDDIELLKQYKNELDNTKRTLRVLETGFESYKSMLLERYELRSKQ